MTPVRATVKLFCACSNLVEVELEPGMFDYMSFSFLMSRFVNFFFVSIRINIVFVSKKKPGFFH